MKKIEKLLGRKLTTIEKMIYKLQKNKSEYFFEKDIRGNLISIKEIVDEPVLITVKCYTCNCTTGIKDKDNYCNMCQHYF